MLSLVKIALIANWVFFSELGLFKTLPRSVKTSFIMTKGHGQGVLKCKVLKKTQFSINAIFSKDSIDSEFGLF